MSRCFAGMPVLSLFNGSSLPPFDIVDLGHLGGMEAADVLNYSMKARCVTDLIGQNNTSIMLNDSGFIGQAKVSQV